MAGGMRTRPGIPLKDRRLDFGADGPPRPIASRDHRSQRHCWVAVDGHSPRPGLVLEWRQQPATGEWLALVVYVIEDEGSAPYTVQGWLPSTTLRPAVCLASSRNE